MRKYLSLVVIALSFSLIVGCSNQSSEGKEEAPKVSVGEIVEEIKEQIAADMKEDGASEEVYVDGKLQSYFDIDLLGEDEQSAAIYVEKMQLNKEELASGRIVTAMMNVNADEIIVLEAKDEASVESLKESLEKEKEAQNSTWEKYLPDQHEKVKNNVITTNGNYLLYVTYKDPETIVDIFDSYFE